MYKLLPFLLLISLSNCNQPLQEEESNTNSSDKTTISDDKPQPNPENEKLEQFDVLITEANKVRLRSQPRLTSKIVEALPINTVLFYLNKQSKSPKKIKINGLEHNAHWLKVRTTNNQEGWVYGSEGVDEQNYAALIRFMKKTTASENPIAVVENVSASTLETLTDLQGINPEWNYSGYYQYTQINGAKKLNGDIEFVGRIFNEEYKNWSKNTYSGQFVNGFPKGNITQLLFNAEAKNKTVIEYEGGTNSCKKITVATSNEGEQMVKEFNQPTRCSFNIFGDEN